ncbi:MAG TPA: RNA polymerase sigma factor [Polyangia bacterium]|jgi:RNA polymerase sigma-70 factor (ECF subfamily)|nr:RNA polymerase sigma factor [Polyangia bacterium]
MNRSRRETPSDEMQDVRSAVRVVLRRLVGAEDPEYEDLVQSSIEHVLVTFERGKFRGECPTGGWAAVIARNVAIDAIRARSRERQLFARDVGDLTDVEGARGLDPKMGPEHLTGVQERLRRVKSALLGLGVQKANVVFLHDVLGHELGDVAGILGITVAAAQSRLVRGRREIIDEIDPDAAPGMKTGARRVVTRAVTKAGRAHPSPGGKQPRKRPLPMLS